MARFFDGESGRAYPATVTAEATALRIVAGEGGGHLWSRRRLRWSAPDPDGWTTIREAGPARLLVDATEAARLQADAVLRARRAPGTIWLATVIGLIAAIGFIVLAFDRGPSLIAAMIPVRWEAALGNQAAHEVVGNRHLCGPSPGLDALRALAGRLAAAAGLPASPQVDVVDSTTINAFALPGNRVLVMRGLIDAAQDGDELSGVLAHELGHLRHRDSTVALVRSAALSGAMLAIGLGGGDQVAVLAAGLLGFSYGRDMESAADATAIATLARAGLHTDGLGRFLSVLDAHDHGRMPGFLSDHPTTDARRRALADAPRGGTDALDAAEWRQVKQICTVTQAL